MPAALSASPTVPEVQMVCEVPSKLLIVTLTPLLIIIALPSAPVKFAKLTLSPYASLTVIPALARTFEASVSAVETTTTDSPS